MSTILGWLIGFNRLAETLLLIQKKDRIYRMPFDVDGWKQCGFGVPPLARVQVPLAAHVQAYATLKAGESKAKYQAAFDAVKKAYTKWEQIAAQDKTPANQAAHEKFLAIGKAEYNAIYLGMQKYNGKLQNAVAQRQNALAMMDPWDKEFTAFIQLTPQLFADAKKAWKNKDKKLAAQVLGALKQADKSAWIKQCYDKYKTSTEPWRNANTGLDPTDLGTHCMPLTTKIYAIGNRLNKARELIGDFKAAYNTAKAV